MNRSSSSSVLKAAAPMEGRSRSSSRASDMHHADEAQQHAATPRPNAEIERVLREAEEEAQQKIDENDVQGAALDVDDRVLLDCLEKAKENLFLTLEEYEILMPMIVSKRERVSGALAGVLYGLIEDVMEHISKFNEPKKADANSEFGSFSSDQTLRFVSELKEKIRKQQDIVEFCERKMAENSTVLQKHLVQMDFLRGQLRRREKELAKQRERFFKDILMLREQLYRKKQGHEVPAMGMMWTLNDPDEDHSDGEDDDQDPSRLRDANKKLQAALKEAKDKSREEIKVLTMQHENEVQRLQKQLFELRKELDGYTITIGDKAAGARQLQKDIRALQEQHEELERELEVSKAKLSDREETIMQLQEDLNLKTRTILDLEEEIQVARDQGNMLEIKGEKMTKEEVIELLEEANRLKLQASAREAGFMMRINRLEMILADVMAQLERRLSGPELTLAEVNEIKKGYEDKLKQLKELFNEEQRKNKGLRQDLRDKEAEMQQRVADLNQQMQAQEHRSNESIQALQQEIMSLQTRALQSMDEQRKMQDQITVLEKKLKDAPTMEQFKKLQEAANAQKEQKANNSTADVSRDDNSPYPREEAIKKMGVIQRISIRHQIAEQKLKEKREQYINERKAQLEEVLNATRGIDRGMDEIDVMEQSLLEQQKKKQAGPTSYWSELTSALQRRYDELKRKRLEKRQNGDDSTQDAAYLTAPTSPTRSISPIMRVTSPIGMVPKLDFSSSLVREPYPPGMGSARQQISSSTNKRAYRASTSSGVGASARSVMGSMTERPSSTTMMTPRNKIQQEQQRVQSARPERRSMNQEQFSSSLRGSDAKQPGSQSAREPFMHSQSPMPYLVGQLDISPTHPAIGSIITPRPGSQSARPMSARVTPRSQHNVRFK